jgi:ABC-type transport system substrate-binding protein
LVLLSLVLISGFAITACQPQEVVTTVEVTREVEVEKEVEVEVTREVEVEVEPEPEEEEEAAGECCDVYSMGMYEEPVSLNYWNRLGPGSSVWTFYATSGLAASLYTLSDQRFDFVPSLAKDVVEPVQEGDVWTFTVEMLQGSQWSDGEAITADDVVFTHNTCKDLALTQNWPNQCAPLGIDVGAEAVDEYTVRYTFHTTPSLGTWQAGIALAPILPEHFWGDTVGEARAFIEGVEEPDVERPADCEAEDLSDEEQEACEAWATYDEAFENARKTLYEADATGQPAAGGMITEQWEAGAFVQRAANENYFFEGAEIVEYDDGTWMQNLADGTTRQLYGEAAGEETLRFTGGPYAPNVIMSLYGSQDSAFLALQEGEIDFVFSPTGIPRGLRDTASRTPGINTYVNADYGMYYLAFNMRKYPMSEPEFRQAFDIVIDKEFVVNSVLQGTVFPMYSTMPPGNGFFYNPGVEFPYKDLSREERVNAAVEVLTEAGWSWSEDPYWDADLEDVVPGTGLTMPNGEPMPELTILGPGPAYDPLRATFNQWISEWARELGMPVESELTGFNTILGPVFVEANFDMYILGWGLGNPAFPDYYESFWHSRNDTATTGNFNTPGMQDEEYDALVDEFMNSTDMQKAKELVFELQEMLAGKRPYICLFYKQVHDVARDNLVFPYTEVLSGITDAAGFQTDAQPLFR